MIAKVPMTVTGASQMRTELERLKKEVRPKIIKAIAEARAFGDLSENAEYHSARNEQGLVEAKIRDLEYKLANATIIDIQTLCGKEHVVFGATVTLLNLDNDQTQTYQIVGDDEADLKLAKISVNAPLARAVIGKKVAEAVEVITPAGIVEYEIIEIKYV